MTEWTPEDLKRIGNATELRVSSLRKNGTLRPYVTIWVVRVSDDLYIRSAYGADNPWFVRAKASGEGRVKADSIERDVTFMTASPDARAAIDAAYHAKYDRYGQAIVRTVVGPDVVPVTLRILHRD